MVNAAGKGIVHINDLGGPNVTPASKMADALRRGVIDALCTAAGYYQGTVQEADIFLGTSMTPAEIRQSGAFATLQKIWADKLHAKLLGMFQSSVKFRLYTTKKPAFGADGLPNLKGLKIRTSPSTRDMLQRLGATTVLIPVTEMYTGLERGLVQGVAWPSVGLTDLGVQKFLKYWVDPPFGSTAVLALVNLDTWQKLTKEAQKVLEDQAVAHEEASRKHFLSVDDEQKALMRKAGMTGIVLKDKVAKAWLALAQATAWERLAKTTSPEHAAKLRAEFER